MSSSPHQTTPPPVSPFTSPIQSPKSTAGGEFAPPPSSSSSSSRQATIKAAPKKKKARRKAQSWAPKKKKAAVTKLPTTKITTAKVPLPPDPNTKKGGLQLELEFEEEMERKKKRIRFSVSRGNIERKMPVASRKLWEEWLEKEDLEWRDEGVLRIGSGFLEGDEVRKNRNDLEGEVECGCTRCGGALGDVWELERS